MSEITLGIFTHTNDAEYALSDLKDAGFDPKDTSVIMKDRQQAEMIDDHTGTPIPDSAMIAPGLLMGTSALTLPGLDGLLVGGPLVASIMTGATTRVVVGLLGTLMNLGISEEDARVYEESINAGGILVAVPHTAKNSEEARTILEENDADQIRVVTLEHERLLRRPSFK